MFSRAKDLGVNDTQLLEIFSAVGPDDAHPGAPRRASKRVSATKSAQFRNTRAITEKPYDLRPSETRVFRP